MKRQWIGCLAALAMAGAAHAGTPNAAREEFVIVNARVMTVSHGTIEGGSVWVRDGRIAGVGETVPAPAGVRTIDAEGRYVTPGMIDAHSHIGMGGLYDPQDTNEYEGTPWGTMAGPNQADLQIRDSIKTDDYAFYLLLSSGMTAGLELPGSANLFGGQAVPIKLKVGRPREDFFVQGAPVSIKIACGSTPVGVWRGRGVGLETLADVARERREAYDAARAYMARQDAWAAAHAAGDDAEAPPVDLKMEALAGILRGTTLLHMHCHSAESMAEELAVARDYGFTLHTIHHATEAYKLAPEIAAAGTGVLGTADLFGGAPQVADGIPWNVLIDQAAGVRVALHGESFSIARRLSQEAGKMLRYSDGRLTRDEALALVTLNAAWVMGLDDRLGSIDIGKDADLVIWDGDPLSTYGHAGQVYIDGELYFDDRRPGLGLVAAGEQHQ